MCQRLLALGVVVVALVPAAGVVSLDVVGVAPTRPVEPRQPIQSTVQAPADGRSVEQVDDQLREYAVETTHDSEVPAAPVDPVVREVSLTPKSSSSTSGKSDGSAEPGRADKPTRVPDTTGTAPDQPSSTEVVSDPQAVTGLGAVGVTWDGSTEVADDAIAIQVRTEKDGAWSEWSDLTYHEEHGPDPDSEEAKKARPGTDGTVVGDVDQVQVRVEMTEGDLPPDLKLAVVDPGTATATEEEAPGPRRFQRRRHAVQEGRPPGPSR